MPSRRLSRPGVLAFGAAIGASLALGCGASHDPGDGGRDAGAAMADGGSDAAVSDDAGFDAGNIALPYGTPPLDERWV